MKGSARPRSHLQHPDRLLDHQVPAGRRCFRGTPDDGLPRPRAMAVPAPSQTAARCACREPICGALSPVAASPPQPPHPRLLSCSIGDPRGDKPHVNICSRAWCPCHALLSDRPAGSPATLPAHRPPLEPRSERDTCRRGSVCRRQSAGSTPWCLRRRASQPSWSVA